MTDDMASTLMGGGLVLAGVAMSQIVTIVNSSLERLERRQKLRREKYEELCVAMMGAASELQDVFNLKGFDAVTSCRPPASLGTVCYLATIYFEELRQPARHYQDMVVELQRYLGRCFNPEHPGSFLAQTVQTPDFQRFNNQALDAKAALETAIELHADKYTKA